MRIYKKGICKSATIYNHVFSFRIEQWNSFSKNELCVLDNNLFPPFIAECSS